MSQGVVIGGLNSSGAELSAGNTTFFNEPGTISCSNDPMNWNDRYDIRIKRAGTVRITFSISKSGPNGASARIYKNYVPVGTQRDATTSPVVYSEDFIVSVNDIISVYMNAGTSTTINMTGFNLKSAQVPMAIKETIITV